MKTPFQIADETVTNMLNHRRRQRFHAAIRAAIAAGIVMAGMVAVKYFAK